MNNAPLTLILIASLGIVAVISLGIFFAVRPRFADTDEQLAADFIEQPQLQSSGSPSSPPITTTVNEPHENSINKELVYASSASPTPAAEAYLTGRAAVPVGGQSTTPGRPSGTSNTQARAQPGEPTFGQSSRKSAGREIVSTVELLDSLRVAPNSGNGQDVQATAKFVPGSIIASGPNGDGANAGANSVLFKELSVEKELDMHRYGKVVGMAYRKGRLYVPSYQSGNISVYKADTLDLLGEYSCSGCHIYDVGVLSNGDIVISQGKYLKLTKLSQKNGSVVNEVAVTYSSKGIAVSVYDEIFVLARDHNTIYVYDSGLTQLGAVPFDNKAKSDCNFLTYGSDLIYVSCESAIHVINVQGKEIQTLRPVHGAYAIGVAAHSDSNGNVYVGQRGASVADVYDKNGTYVESVGEKKDSLWSDIAVGGRYLYVIDYITTTIKQYRLN